ncbi:ROK family transcriptional regulator [Agreia sp. VKM Ac-1783]|jgi:predicted NBD/HSP70 family sugar kinase|uniref:ROK family transcriptional regulator n=1 Tax=Agreia sp. VKM Ac-1783 TaxID=1938889 RepID=UPI000A2AB25D|nr:ROK family transcriptional regulator [Agreia sp. VKM Ac-1783]SMQ75344.1 Sugar kinase of the NBD/HSP70 family, may contain an N-terminal HTH domain [Agreia sp. VKM Ac-1783]
MNMKKRTATTRVVTQINRTAILDCLEENGPLSRKQIGEKTGLSPATVERLSAAMLAEGILAHEGMQQSSGGRPSNLLRAAGESRVIAAVDVRRDSAHGLLRDFGRKTVVTEVVVFDDDPATGAVSASTRLAGTLALTQRLVEAAAGEKRELMGIGISVPGIVHDGRVMNTAELGWRDIALASIVASATDLPVHVENDANCIAFGEWALGAGRGTQSVASYLLGEGVGAGIVNNGEIYRGFRSAAGEVGFLFTERGALARYFTDQGDLESRIAGIASTHGQVRLAAPEAMQRLLDDAAEKIPSAKDAADELFDLLAFSCGALATVLDPEVIVLAGHLARHPAFAIREISARLVGRIPFPPRLVAGTLGDDGALLGVAEIITRQVRGSTYLA